MRSPSTGRGKNRQHNRKRGKRTMNRGNAQPEKGSSTMLRRRGRCLGGGLKVPNVGKDFTNGSDKGPTKPSVSASHSEMGGNGLGRPSLKRSLPSNGGYEEVTLPDKSPSARGRTYSKAVANPRTELNRKGGAPYAVQPAAALQGAC